MVTKYPVVPFDMRLYSPAEPEGRVFTVGEPWPGDAWSEHPPGTKVDDGAVELAEKLAKAEAEIKRLERQAESASHDRANLNMRALGAEAKVEGLESDLALSKRAQAEAEEIAQLLTRERDEARAEAAKAGEYRERVRELEADLISIGAETAQGRAEIKARLAAAAAMDHDGDGKPGGRRKRAEAQA